MTTLEFTLYTDDGGEETVVLPAAYEVCWNCRGNGTTVNPAIDGNGLSNEDFDADPDFRDDYFSGVYDVACSECKGLRVTLVVDEKLADPGLLAEYHAHLDEKYAYEAECAAERRMGA